ncbi:LysR substrate-binding domain-containing protein [Aquaspirillum serpens]|uniref:LysR substrate-binding domain-containing protein n=1 Tax=Aquaspirillum serpens TaxID=190 RepID=UPI0003B72B2D|nr:LysR substrate-binding domain-containing protein [Aquaspirillum serpens]
MTLTELRYIVAVARERHFGRAATRCFVSQPTLSIAVKKFEEELGISLFERGTEITITPQGEPIIQQAQLVLEQVERLRLLASSQQNQLAGPLRLGIIFTISPYLLPRLIPALQQTTPEMPLYLEENYTSRLTEMLKLGEIDAAIVAEPFEESGLATLPLYDEPFIVATPRQHPWAQRTQIAPQELAQESILLLAHGNCFRDQVLALCDRHSEPSLPHTPGLESWQHGLQGSSLTTVRHMVAGGLGITVLPLTSVQNGDEAMLSLIPFTPPAPTRRVVLAYRRQYPRQKAIAALAEAIYQCGLAGVTMLPSVR